MAPPKAAQTQFIVTIQPMSANLEPRTPFTPLNVDTVGVRARQAVTLWRARQL